jgi:hypothetical protein
VRAAPESADEYPHVVAMLTDGRRVIECAADIQWVIQVHKGRPLNPWEGRAAPRRRSSVSLVPILTLSDFPIAIQTVGGACPSRQRRFSSPPRYIPPSRSQKSPLP